MKRLLIFFLILILFSFSNSLADNFTDDFNKLEKKVYKTLKEQYAFNSIGIWNLFAYRYSKGTDGFPKDFNRSLFWFEKASDDGYPLATFNLGVAYFNGDLELDRNFQKAHELLTLSFEQRFIDKKDLFYTNLEELENAFEDDFTDPTGEFKILKNLFLDALVLPSNTRYKRLKNLTKKDSEISSNKILEEFIKTEEIICSGEDIFKIKIIEKVGDFIVLRKLTEMDEKYDDLTERNEFLLQLQYAKRKDNEIEWFRYIFDKSFGLELNNFTHYKLFLDKKNKLKLYEQPYFIKSNKEFNKKMNQKYQYKSYDLFENPGGQKHMELEEDFYQELKNNYQNIVKDTNNGASLTKEYLCEI